MIVNKLFVHSTVLCNQTVKCFELPNALHKFFIIMFIIKKDWLVKKKHTHTHKSKKTNKKKASQR